jgi:sec-independent protein translocase protein TatB
MFDLGISELGVAAVVALIVLGPERLPRVARQLGQWIGKLQRYVADVKSDINRQMDLEDLRKLQGEVNSAAKEVESSVRSAVDGAQAELDSISASIQSNSGSNSQTTDWDRVYAHRRMRERIRDRRIERDRELHRKRPKRRFYR